ncbi:hypothetical protein BAE44_0000869, partial [Dichanthelium oligosanthes]
LKMEEEKEPGREKEKQKWKRPHEDTLKINVDSSFRQESRDGGWGFVIRDCESKDVKACGGKLSMH